MTSFKEKERLKDQQEKFQAILSALLKDEDNKYCVDCDAKGPRWASWNLGIFMCIRCAGIHRNLGVHISKVKSVNLDTWTPEQVAMMQEMGNSRARAVYEANIPDGFRRPQSDSGLESLIRSKYEHKKYIAREWIPPQPKVPKEWLEDPKAEKKKAKAKLAGATIQLPNVPKPTNKPAVSTSGDAPKPSQGTKTEIKIESSTNSASNDLLGLDLGSPQTNTQQAAAPVPSSGGNELLDLFGGQQTSQAPNSAAPVQAQAPAGSSDLMNGTSEGNLFGEEKTDEKKASTKDSILALYGGGGGGGAAAAQPQMYGVPAPQPEMMVPNANPPTLQNGSGVLMKLQDNRMNSSQVFAQTTVSTNNPFHQNQFMMQSSFNQSGVVPSTSANQIPATAAQSSGTNFGTPANQMMPSGQYPAFGQSSFTNVQHMAPPLASTSHAPTSVGHASPQKLSQSSPTKQRALLELQNFGQSMGQMPTWPAYNQLGFYGNQGGVYMPQGQQMYPGMMGQQQGMMGQQGMRPPQTMMGQQQGMMGQPQGMVGQQQGMGMMGQPQGVMGQPQGMMGNPQMGVYNGQMIAGNPGMYNPQQMQQLQFQQMQQQMTSMKLNGAQTGNIPQQTTPAPGAGWGGPNQGHTLSTNLWQ